MNPWVGGSKWGRGLRFNGSILVHLPLGFAAAGSFAFVKHHRLLEANHSVINRVNVIRRTGGLPVAGSGGSARPSAASFPLLPWAEEKPLLSVSSAQLPRKL